MQEWVLIALFLVSGLLFYAIGAVGGSALVFLWLPKVSRAVQAFLSCLPLPGFFSLVIVATTTLDPVQDVPASVIGAVTLLFAPGLLVGWPCAFLTLRALERRVERAGVKAQEIFE